MRNLFDGLAGDLRYTLRVLRSKPSFTAVAVASLALGIGANTAIFTLIDTVLLRQLPVKDPAGLVMVSDPDASGVFTGTSRGRRGLLSTQEFEQLRDRTVVFSGLLAAQAQPAPMEARLGQGPAEQVVTEFVSTGYFRVLGVTPLAGATFDGNPAAVISHAFWWRRFGGDPAAIGRAITIRKTQLTIAGIMPPGFSGENVGSRPDIWVPLALQPQLMPGRDWLHDDYSKVERVMWLHVMGRLKPGITRKEAAANVAVVFSQLVKQQAAAGNEERRRELLAQTVELSDGRKGASTLRGDASEPLLMLMGVVALVLLIACANIANLLLARAASRQKEIGVRVAMGAGRWRLVRQALTESTVLALAGGAAGLLVSVWGSGALVALTAGDSINPLETHPDLRVLAFTAALSLATGILFGLAPALRIGAFNPGSALKENSRGLTESGRRLSAGRALVAGQVALSLVLLIVAGLFLRTLTNLKNVNLGYARDKLLTVRVDAVEAGYPLDRAGALYSTLLDRLRALPGVRAATFSENGLFGGTESGDEISVEGYKPDKPGGTSARFDQVGPDYFAAVGIPILLGRGIGPEDTASAPKVCVINEALARRFFGGRNPIGKHLTDEFPDTRSTFEIVGVSRNARDHQLRGEVPPRFYLPTTQSLGPGPAAVNFEIRTFADPGRMLQTVRRTIRDVDNNVSTRNAKTFDAVLDDSVEGDRAIAQLSGFFGGVALLLAALGIYGVLSYAIARRTNELGIRVALGAAPGQLLRMILRESLLLVAIGAVCGIPLAFAASRAISSRLYGLGMADPLTLAVAVAALGGVAMLAGFVPARRAARVDPVVALRSE
jgi:predicted permease